MNLGRVIWGIGWILLFFSVTFVVPFIAAFVYDTQSEEEAYAETAKVPFTDIDSHVPRTALIFLIGLAATATTSVVMMALGSEGDNLRPREGYAVVGIGWVLIAMFGSLPYLLLAGVSPIEAFFESMSGFTTTGATILPGSLESYAPSLMLWRAFQQWIGGMGIIVLSVALLATLTHGGHQLMQAETPGIKMERIKPKIIQTAQVLWTIYAVYSLILWVVLTTLIHFTGVKLPMGEAIYEGLLHTFTTMSSGGFSNHDASTAFFASAAIDVVLIVSMFLVGLNFTRHYAMLTDRDPRHFLQDPETRFYALIVVGTSLFVSSVLWFYGTVPGATDALRIGTMQSVAIITTTGFAPAVFDEWPDAARLVLLFMFFTGGAAGSTAGGMKVIRILVLMKLIKREIKKLLHPRAVVPVRLGKAVLGDDVLKTVSVFFFAYVTIFIFSTVFMTLLGLDMVSAISAVASALGNIGPALGSVHLGYQSVHWVGQLWLAILMWAGRLEIFTVLLLFFPSTWRR